MNDADRQFNSGDELPEDSVLADRVMGLTERVLESIPFAGPFIAEIFGWMKPTITKAQVMWLNTLAARISKLENLTHAFTAEALAQDPDFVAQTLYASQIAMRTSNVEKRIALQNVLLNSAIKGTVEEDIQRMVLSAIDNLTATQLSILRFFEDPINCLPGAKPYTAEELEELLTQGRSTHWMMNASFPADMSKVDEHAMDHVVLGRFTECLPEVWANTELAQYLVNDLHFRGLLADSWPESVFHQGLPCRITLTGKLLLEYVRSPLPNEDELKQP